MSLSHAKKMVEREGRKVKEKKIASLA
jgi:hypothetical protein